MFQLVSLIQAAWTLWWLQVRTETFKVNQEEENDAAQPKKLTFPKSHVVFFLVMNEMWLRKEMMVWTNTLEVAVIKRTAAI